MIVQEVARFVGLGPRSGVMRIIVHQPCSIGLKAGMWCLMIGTNMGEWDLGP